VNGGLSDLAGRTQAVYERNAARFDAERTKGLHERVWLDRFTDGLPTGARVLDVGCGTGDPIADHLADRGFRVTGVDASQEMLRLARSRRPVGDWRLADMRALDLGQRFGGILGWNSFFHLTRDEQRAVLPRLAAHLEPGGALMLTVGPEDGEVAGKVGSEAVHHASLAPEEYRSILAGLGIAVTDFVTDDPDCAGQTVLLARKQGEEPE
jgi:trans-aconitate methyltransferase